MQVIVEQEKEAGILLKKKIVHLEGIIIQQQNMMETTGYLIHKEKLQKKDDELADVDTLDRIENLSKMEEENKIPLKAREVFTGAKSMLD